MRNAIETIYKKPALRYSLIFLVALAWCIPYYSQSIWSSAKLVTTETMPKNQQAPQYQETFINEDTGTLCHAATITEVDGKMLCTWYEGSDEGEQDVAIRMSYLENGTWSPSQVLVDRLITAQEQHRHVRKIGNSVVFADTKGNLWLFYSTVAVGGWAFTNINYKMSKDSGKTWSKSQRLLLSPLANLTYNVKNKPVFLEDGSFLLPIYHELMQKYSSVLWVKPTETGIVYNVRKISYGFRALQPSFVHDGNSAITAFFRNRGYELHTLEQEKKLEEQENRLAIKQKDPNKKKNGRPKKQKRSRDYGKRYMLMSRSKDLGKTWSSVKETPVPNPNCGFDFVLTGDGSYLGAINDSFEYRNSLCLVISKDQGKTWKKIKVLDKTDGTRQVDQFSYSSIVKNSNNVYHVVYSYYRKRIKHVSFNDAWLQQQKLDETWLQVIEDEWQQQEEQRQKELKESETQQQEESND